MTILFALLTIPVWRRLLPRFSICTRSRIIAMVGSKHRRKMSRTTWGWEKTERRVARFWGNVFGKQHLFARLKRCSKLKGKLLSKKKQMSLWSHLDILFLLMHLQNSSPWIFHHRLNLEVCRAREVCPVNPTKSPYICILWFPPKWVPFNDPW